MSARLLALTQDALAAGAFDDLSQGERAELFVLCNLADDDGRVTIRGTATSVIAQHLNREQRRRTRRTK